LRIRLVIFCLLVAGLISVLAGASVAYAQPGYNPQSPGTKIFKYTDYGNTLHNTDRIALEYRGVNASGNHVVIAIYNTTVGPPSRYRISTYEISQSGTPLGRIYKSGTINTGYSAYPCDIIRYPGTDYHLIADNHTTSSLEITSEGAVGPLDDTTTNDAVEFILLEFPGEDVILSNEYNTLYTYQVDGSDGSIDQLDSWVSVPLRELCRIAPVEHLDDVSERGFIVFDRECGALEGKYHVSAVQNHSTCSGVDKGDIGTFASGCTFNDTGDAIFTHQTCTELGPVQERYIEYTGIDNLYAMLSIDALNPEIEILELRAGTLVKHSKIEVHDSNASCLGLQRMGDGHITLYYKDGNTAYMRMLWAISSSGTITQAANVSQAIPICDVSNMVVTFSEPRDYICRLGTSPYTVFAAGTGPGLSQILQLNVIQHRIPPTVDTTALYPLTTSYNTTVDAAFDVSGAVTNCGDTPVTEWGFCYNTSGFPTYAGSRVTYTGTRTSPFDFNDEVWDLAAAQRYYFAAYACNASGTGYGDVLNSYGFPDYPYTIARWTFEPVDISSGTIMDITGNGHDISFTLYNPNLDITGGPITPTNIAEYTCEGTECEHFWTPQFVTPDGYILNPGSVNTPWGDFLPENTIPGRLFWLSGLTILMCALGFFIYKWTRVLLTVAVTGLLCILIACSIQWMGWWVFVMAAILTPGLLLKDESRNPF